MSIMNSKCRNTTVYNQHSQRTTPIKMDIIGISRRKPMIRLNTIKSPIDHRRNLPENFQVENFSLKTRGGIETSEYIAWRVDCGCYGAFTINIGWDIEYMSH